MRKNRRLQTSSGTPPASDTWLRVALDAAGMTTWEWHVPLNRIRYSSNAAAVARGRNLEPYSSVDSLMQQVHPDDRGGLARAVLQTTVEGLPFQCEYRVLMLDGRYHWILGKGKIVQVEDGRPVRVLGVSQDITERKVAEHRLHRANRTLMAIRECGEALIRERSEPRLLEEICRTIVKTGGGQLVWIGYVGQDARKTVRLMAQAGYNRGFLEQARFAWSDGPRGRGPVGAAIRANRPAVCPDTAADPGFALWRKEALKRGCRSVLALPLAVEERCLGVLVIHSREADAFDEEERRFLTDLANDLARSITALRLRAERNQLQRQLLNIREREQQRIGRDLHDGLCQATLGAAMMSEALEDDLRRRSLPGPARKANRIAGLIRSVGREARRLSHGLSPVGLEEDGLMTALEDLALSTTRLLHVTTRFHCPGRVLLPDPRVAVHLFRIAQEAVNNAVRHAHPTAIAISLQREAGGVLLSVADDGRGLQRRQPSGGGLGLAMMRHRAELIGATLRVEAGRRNGATVLCRMPRSALENEPDLIPELPEASSRRLRLRESSGAPPRPR